MTDNHTALLLLPENPLQTLSNKKKKDKQNKPTFIFLKIFLSTWTFFSSLGVILKTWSLWGWGEGRRELLESIIWKAENTGPNVYISFFCLFAIFAPSFLLLQRLHLTSSPWITCFLTFLSLSQKPAASSEPLNLPLQGVCSVTCLCDRFHFLHVLSSTRFLPQQVSKKLFFFLFYNVPHRKSGAPFNKGGSRPLWGFGNKRFRCVTHEQASHFTEQHTAGKKALKSSLFECTSKQTGG